MHNIVCLSLSRLPLYLSFSPSLVSISLSLSIFSLSHYSPSLCRQVLVFYDWSSDILTNRFSIFGQNFSCLSLSETCCFAKLIQNLFFCFSSLFLLLLLQLPKWQLRGSLTFPNEQKQEGFIDFSAFLVGATKEKITSSTDWEQES